MYTCSRYHYDCHACMVHTHPALHIRTYRNGLQKILCILTIQYHATHTVIQIALAYAVLVAVVFVTLVLTENYCAVDDKCIVIVMRYNMQENIFKFSSKFMQLVNTINILCFYKFFDGEWGDK
jgi:hypothetical protein